MELQAPDEETMVSGAVADLVRRFPSIDRSRIEDTVRPLVREWFAQASVTSFVGVFAERQARAELERTMSRT